MLWTRRNKHKKQTLIGRHEEGRLLIGQNKNSNHLLIERHEEGRLLIGQDKNKKQSLIGRNVDEGKLLIGQNESSKQTLTGQNEENKLLIGQDNSSKVKEQEKNSEQVLTNGEVKLLIGKNTDKPDEKIEKHKTGNDICPLQQGRQNMMVAKRKKETLAHIKTCTTQFKTCKNLKLNLNINIVDKTTSKVSDKEKMTLRLTFDFSTPNVNLIRQHKTLNLNVRVTVKDKRHFVESLQTSKITKHVNYAIWK